MRLNLEFGFIVKEVGLFLDLCLWGYQRGTHLMGEACSSWVAITFFFFFSLILIFSKFNAPDLVYYFQCKVFTNTFRETPSVCLSPLPFKPEIHWPLGKVALSSCRLQPEGPEQLQNRPAPWIWVSASLDPLTGTRFPPLPYPSNLASLSPSLTVLFPSS